MIFRAYLNEKDSPFQLEKERNFLACVYFQGLFFVLQVRYCSGKINLTRVPFGSTSEMSIAALKSYRQMQMAF